MFSNRYSAYIVVPILLVLLGAGITHIFSMRFETGDVYPRYSSLRSDPLGARGFHDSLKNIPALSVERNYRGLHLLDGADPSVLFLNGIPSKDWFLESEELAQEIKSLAVQGSRVVVTFSIRGDWAGVDDYGQDYVREDEAEEEKSQKAEKDGQSIAPGAHDDSPEDAPLEEEVRKVDAKAMEESYPPLESKDLPEPELILAEEDVTPAPKKNLPVTAQTSEAPSTSEDETHDPEGSGKDPVVREKGKSSTRKHNKIRDFLNLHEKDSGLENWGLAMRQGGKNAGASGIALLHADLWEKDLPPTLTWNTDWYFMEITTDWKVIYSRDGNPVMLERAMGKGSLVFASDSYFFSNEALAESPPTELLLWLLDSHNKVIFDEWHLGTVKRTNITQLARRYGLAGAGIVLVLWALMFVWQNATPLVPRKSPDTRDRNGNEHVSSRGYAEAMTSLLRRNLSAGQVLKQCLAMWESSLPKKSIPEKRKREIRDALLNSNSTKEADTVQAYNRAADILARE